MINVLVVEDDQGLNETVCRHLNVNGYRAIGCLSAKEAYDVMYEKSIDLIISDIMMPEIDGFEFVESVRRIEKNMPILFMTARDDFAAKSKGYDLGIDDYMVKPIHFEELLLRIRALLRIANIASNKRIEAGNLIADENEVVVYVNDKNVDITLKEFKILFKLLSYPGKAFTRSQLLDEYSGYDTDISLRAVDVMITNIRGKIKGASGVRIDTVRGLGYKAVIE